MAYPPAMSCGTEVSGRCAARAGTATRGTVSSAPIADVSGMTSRQAEVAMTPGDERRNMSSLSTVDRRGGAAPTSPAESRSATTAPSTVAVAAIQAVHARLESQLLSPAVSVAVGHVMMPSPYPRPSAALAVAAAPPSATATDPPQPREAMPRSLAAAISGGEPAIVARTRDTRLVNSGQPPLPHPARL